MDASLKTHYSPSEFSVENICNACSVQTDINTIINNNIQIHSGGSKMLVLDGRGFVYKNTSIIIKLFIIIIITTY